MSIVGSVCCFSCTPDLGANGSSQGGNNGTILYPTPLASSMASNAPFDSHLLSFFRQGNLSEDSGLVEHFWARNSDELDMLLKENGIEAIKINKKSILFLLIKEKSQGDNNHEFELNGLSLEGKILTITYSLIVPEFVQPMISRPWCILGLSNADITSVILKRVK